MSLREVPSSKPLLARKGAASPANLRTAKGGPVEPSLRSIEGSGEIAPEAAKPDTSADLKASATGERASESTPAASLLPFDLLRKKYRPEMSPDLAEDEPDIIPGDLAPADRAPSDLTPADLGPSARTETAEPDSPPQAELALHAEPALTAQKPAVPTDAKTESKPDLRIEPSVDLPGPARVSAPAPTPDPDWRVGAATVTPPKPQPRAKPQPQAKRSSRGGWLLPFAALAVAFAVLIVGWNMANPTFDFGFLAAPGAPEATAPKAPASAATNGTAGEAAAPMAVEVPPPVTAALPQPVLSPTPESLPSTGEAADQSAPATAPASAAPPPPQAASTSTRPAPETSAPETSVLGPTVAGPASEAPAVVKPSVDVVRLEANDEAVIAGRAAPNSELIILDNGKPIGTARADAFGEWVFVPETALPAGDHEFGLVLKTVQESVSLPAPNKPLLPPAPGAAPTATAPESALGTPPSPEAAVSPDAASGAETSPSPVVAPVGRESAVEPAPVPAPVPVRKPAADDVGAAPGSAPADDHAAAKGADFVVQLASVKTRAGAEQEWSKLQQRFPDILADMVPALDEVKLADYGTVVRVRTGPFDSQREAASLCARLASQNQACLVVRTSTGN